MSVTLHLRLRAPVLYSTAAGAVPSVSQFRLAPYQCEPGPGRAGPDERRWLRQAVAAVHTGHGGGTHRSCMEPARSADVPRAAVATDADGLKQRRQLTIAVVNGSGVLR